MERNPMGTIVTCGVCGRQFPLPRSGRSTCLSCIVRRRATSTHPRGRSPGERRRIRSDRRTGDDRREAFARWLGVRGECLLEVLRVIMLYGSSTQ
jgi:hypothetical protein